MPRPIWKGAITFGMISIPVKLYGATESKDLAFNMLHKPDKSRLKQKRWCPVDDREVFQDEIVRAYEYSKERYVEITDEDIDSLPVPSKHTIELTSFVKAADIDPVYFERSYYLEADEVGAKPYALLDAGAEDQASVGRRQDRAAQQGESLCAAGRRERAHARDAVLPGRDPHGRTARGARRAGLAAGADDGAQPGRDARGAVRAQKYHDEYRVALLDMIEAKANGQEVVATPEAPLPQTVDLMAALKASLEAAKKAKPAGGTGTPPSQEPDEPQEELAVAF